MGNLLSLVTGWKGYVAAALVAGLLASTATWRVMSWREQAHQTQAAVQQIKLTDKDIQINMDLGPVVVKGLQIIATETVRREREIPQHVTPEIDRAYPVPLGFVRMWNDAAHGPIPGPAAGGDADPSGVPISDVARAHNEDASTLDSCRLALNTWWAWYDQHAAARK